GAGGHRLEVLGTDAANDGDRQNQGLGVRGPGAELGDQDGGEKAGVEQVVADRHDALRRSGDLIYISKDESFQIHLSRCILEDVSDRIYLREMEMSDLYQLGRRLAEIALADMGAGELDLTPGEFLVLQDLFLNGQSAIGDIAARTGLAQSRVST